MKEFNVYSHPIYKIDAVKSGWCWPAFFFSGIWALISRLWIPAALVFFYALIHYSISFELYKDAIVKDTKRASRTYSDCVFREIEKGNYNNDCDKYLYEANTSESDKVDNILFIAFSPVDLIIASIFGGFGNSWRRNNLENRGFKLITLVTARSKDEAISMFSSTPIAISIVKLPYDDEASIISKLNILHSNNGFIDEADEHGETALFHAIRTNRQMVAKHLLDLGANPFHENKYKMCPSKLAESLGYK